MAAVPVAVGEVIAGKYRVERVLGSGGMGMVVAAWHVQLDQLVAVKLLHSETAGSVDATERFRREARAAARIRSEHVARVIDVGIWTGGIPYIVMEYLEGNDLAAELVMRGPLSPEETAEFVMQAIEALAEAHAVGIVHRDLKPGNLFVARRADGTRLIKVLDFGISKQTAAAGEAALTRTSSLIGSPLYMSPEQMRSARSVDARADIWSLGAIMFELLTGQPPFGGETVIEACTAILNDELPSMAALRPDIPPYLEAIVRRCLEKDRNLRYPSIGDLATELAGFSPASRVHAERALRVLGTGGSRASGQMPISMPSGSSPNAAATPSNAALAISPAGTPSAGTPSPVVAPPLTSSSWERTASGLRARRWPIAVMTLAVLAVIAAVGYREFSPRHAAAPALPPPSAVARLEPVIPVKSSEPVEDPPTVAPASAAPVVSVVPSAPIGGGLSKPVPAVKPRPVAPARHPDAPKDKPNSDGVSDFGGRR